MRAAWILSASVLGGGLAAQIDLAAVRGIERFPGDAQARATLARLGFVTLPGAQGMHGVFATADLPPLLTVDVVLHALIVQQRALLRRIEQRLAPVLAAFCARGFALAADRARQDATFADAARFFGSARRAFGDGWQPATHGELLADSGAPDAPWDCIDTRELEPSSPYRGDRALTQYFAGRRWLGTRRFDVQHPAAARCAQAIADLVRCDDTLRTAHARLVEPFEAWFGPTDVDLATTLTLPDSGRVGLLPARELPCERALREVRRAELTSSPLAILATGPLRSAAGREVLAARTGDATATAVFSLTDPPGTSSTYARFLRALASVHDPLPAVAPALFHSSAWQRRLCETQLGAWLTLREVTSAHSVSIFGGRSEAPPGYVVPYPQTFLAVAELARELEAMAAAWAAPASDRGEPPPSRDQLMWRVDAARTVFPTLRSLDRAEAEKHVQALQARAARGDLSSPQDADIVHAMTSDSIVTRAALVDIARHSEHFARIATRQLRGDELLPDDLATFRTLSGTILGMTTVAGDEDRPIGVPFRTEGDATTWLGTTVPDVLYVVLEFDGTPTLLRGVGYGVAESNRASGEPWRATQWWAAAQSHALPRPPEFASWRGARR